MKIVTLADETSNFTEANLSNYCYLSR